MALAASAPARCLVTCRSSGRSERQARLEVHAVADAGVGMLAGGAVEEDNADDGAAVPGRRVRHLLRLQPAGVGPEEQRRWYELQAALVLGLGACAVLALLLLQIPLVVSAFALSAACLRMAARYPTASIIT